MTPFLRTSEDVLDELMLALLEEIKIADFYCGAGGSSTGMVRAARDVDARFRLTGVNHWTVAISSHSANHPYARHFKMEMEDVPAETLFPHLFEHKAGRRRLKKRLAIAWFSPECTEHSYAKGGSSVNDQRRANAWSVARLAGELRPLIIFVENVVPFTKWGPVEIVRHRNGRPKRDKKGEVIYRPIESKKGETFREWFAAVEAQGYRGEWRLMNAADWGEAQSRTRFIAVFTAPGVKYEWPAATHDRDGANGLSKWVGADSIIDLELPMESIFARERKPLSDNTIERIAAGVPLVIDSPELAAAFQVVLRRNADVLDLGEAAPTVCARGNHLAVAKVSLRPIVCRNQTHNAPSTDEDPAPCLTTAHGGGVFVAKPEVIVLGQHGGGVARKLEEPVSTIATEGYVRIFAPYLVKVNGQLNRWETARSRSRRADQPLGTVTQKNGIGVAELRVTLLGRAPNGTGVVVDVDGTLYIFDCRFRMLEVSELLQFQGLPGDYVLAGNKGERTAQVGNAVPEKLAYGLCRQAFVALGLTGAAAVAA